VKADAQTFSLPKLLLGLILHLNYIAVGTCSYLPG